MAFPVRDALDAVLLGCFLFGIVFSLASLALGFADIGHGGHHGGDAGHAEANGSHGGHAVLALVNLSSALAFLTWFGGIAYLARNGFGWIVPASVLLGFVGGLLGAAAVGLLIRRVLRDPRSVLDPRDYELVGMIGRVTSAIRPGGFGEIVYEQGGTRHVAAARATSANGITRGLEVVVLRLERGVAVVQPWDELLAERDAPRTPLPVSKPPNVGPAGETRGEDRGVDPVKDQLRRMERTSM
ncbi:MAG: hypothetical protein H0W06_03430 [Chloroflexia bacterium]|nr:hypothetical protein [Chloroflexia bacterium]